MTDVIHTASLKTDVDDNIFFNLNDDVEWVDQEYGPNGEGAGIFPESVLGKVDINKYFNGGLWTYYLKSGPFNLLRIKFAPNFLIPRHYHNIDQLVFVLKGEARQGSRVFHPGDGWSTPAGQTYSVSAGPEGCETVEIRTQPLEDLTTNWVEENLARWVRV